ncbi:MAG: oligoendopeptidase F [Oscillospiraceae bacterium]|jgi:oligoendopeptidase F|nr:oligoendopeptidase F [Oscillospiraceae bacterium]
MPQETRILERSEIETQWKWKLEDMFETNGAWEAAFQEAKASLPGLEESARTVADPPADPTKLRAAVLDALNRSSASNQLLAKLYTYARMRRDEDNRAALYQGYVQRMEALEVEAGAIEAPLRPALLALPDGSLESYMADPAFRDYDEGLRILLREREHTLSPEQERVVAMAGEMRAAPSTIFDMLSDADMKFPVINDENGNPVEITHGRYYQLINSRDRRVRREAFEGLHGTYKKYANTIGAAYAASVKGDIFNAKVHKYESSLAASLAPNDIPVSVYDGLVEAVHAHIPALAKLLDARKKLLGLDELRIYDMYVNAEEGFQLNATYPQAREIVLDGLAPLGKPYTDAVRRSIDERWIDVYENAGKTSGAYSWGAYDTHPYILHNYVEEFDSVSTLAHELGHLMHSYYTNSTQPFPKSDYSMFVAEVASTVNEILLSMDLQRKNSDPAAKRFLVGELLESFRGTVFRQTMFAEFERETHAMAERGEPLTHDALSALYRGLNERYYGAAAVIDEAVDAEWSRIPHFYRNFYVYQYATGFSAAAFIARRILREGQAAVDDYMRFLSAGSSVPPIEALKLAGIDMSRKESVDSALDWFDELVDEYVRLFE